MLARGGGELFTGRPGDRFGQIEQTVILALAKILRLKQFGQANHLRAAPGRIGHAFQSFGEILFRLRAARHLYQRRAKFIRGHAYSLLRIG